MAHVLAEQQPIDDAVDEVAEKLVSVIIPCLNEAENIEQCVRSAWDAMASAGIVGEVIVADNGSDDGSAELAQIAGAHVVLRDSPRATAAPTSPASRPRAASTS